MKKAICASLALPIISTTAFGDEPGVYVSPFVGYGTDFEEVYYGAAVGYDMGNGWSVYAQYLGSSSEEAETEDGITLTLDTEFTAFSIGASYSGALNDGFGYSIGGSLGIASWDLDPHVEQFGSSFKLAKFSDEALFFDLFASLDYRLTEAATVYLGVRYYGFDIEFDLDGQKAEETYDDFGIETGLRFKF